MYHFGSFLAQDMDHEKHISNMRRQRDRARVTVTSISVGGYQDPGQSAAMSWGQHIEGYVATDSF